MNDKNMLIGTGGKVWVSGERLCKVKSMQAKATLNYEEVNVTDSYGADHVYTGYAIEGTLKIEKTDDGIAKLVNDGITSGNMPDTQILTNLPSPGSDAQETVELDGVVFTELMIVDFEAKNPVEQEIPFKAKTYHYIDMI